MLRLNYYVIPLFHRKVFAFLIFVLSIGLQIKRDWQFLDKTVQFDTFVNI